MKKLFTLFFTGITCVAGLHAQSITDALRYANQNIEGTARYRSMSGAFGALGGDLSAIQTNPAGAAVFNKSLGAITLSHSNINNDAFFSNSIVSNSNSNLNFNQLGAVFVFKNNDETIPINKLVLGINYDQTSDNEDEFIAAGNSSVSIDRHFLNAAQGFPLDQISVGNGFLEDTYARLGEREGTRAQEALLAYETFILDAVDPSDPSNTEYISNVASGSFNQDYFFESTGFNGKFSVSGAMQLYDRFYLGLNLNSHFINYDQVTRYFEFNSNTGSDINEIAFTNRLSTRGSGFSAHIGGIAKITPFLRLGASLETPTWFLISEETRQALSSDSNTNGTAIANPNVINIFPEYRLRTPAKFTGSAAFIFGKSGLISIDYSYKDYATTKFSSSDDFYDDLDYSFQNNRIKNTLQGAASVRIGGELRHQNWSFRGGLRYEESPYRDETQLGDTNGYSLGLGYNFGKMKLDIAYDYAEQDRRQQFIDSDVFLNTASITQERENITVTFSLSL
ncbi:OmpP1/FadL family transporter [Aquimarina rhabdastrellae]